MLGQPGRGWTWCCCGCGLRLPWTDGDGSSFCRTNDEKNTEKRISLSNEGAGVYFFFLGLEGFRGQPLGRISRLLLINDGDFKPYLCYSSTPHSPEGFIQLKTGRASDVWRQWSNENWYFYLDISRWHLWYFRLDISRFSNVAAQAE